MDAVSLTPDNHPNKPVYLSDLGSSLEARFERLGEWTDIKQSMEAQAEAILLTPDNHPNKPTYLNSLGNSLERRFRRLGDLKDLDESIEAHVKSVSLTPDGHPNKPTYFSNLGKSLKTRFENRGELKDLDESVAAQAMAVSLTPDDDLDPMLLSSLGSLLQARFERFGERKDIDESIEIQAKAVSLTPDDHPNKPTCLNSLCNSLEARFKSYRELKDIDESIDVQTTAVSLTPDEHPNKPKYLNSLGHLLEGRFKRLGDLKDIDESIEAQAKAVSLTPDVHPDKPAYLSSLGNLLERRFERTEEAEDLERAVSSFKASATACHGHPNVRIRSAKQWAALAEMDPSQAMSAYQVLIDLIPQVAWLGSSVQSRHEAIKTFIGDSVHAAVATAIGAQQYEKAVEWLEQGRFIVWGQLLSLRTPPDNLRAGHPMLANALESISRSMQNPAKYDHDQSCSCKEKVQHSRHRLAVEREGIIRHIHSISGFENASTQPKQFEQLVCAAHDGPLVIVNLHKSRCDALILKPGQSSVHHVLLTDCSVEAISTLHTKLQLALHDGQQGNGDAIFKETLQTLWQLVVRPVLMALNLFVSTFNISFPSFTLICPG
jgi:tetratricopeptide (TPR) repeat protein